MTFFRFIFQDWDANRGNTKGRFLTLFFRLGNYCNGRSKVLEVLFTPYLLLYKFLFGWVLGFELPFNTEIGKGLKVFHGHSIVINSRTRIGCDFIIRQSTTIGNKFDNGECPQIGDNVSVGCNSCLLGDIVIGDNVIIGAGSVVLKDIPINSIVGGNPASLIRYNHS